MTARTIDEVVDALDRITADAIRERDRIGYFAALYRKVTAEVRDSVRRGEFLDGERMERLDVRFANRYLDALDAYRAGRPLTDTWRITFDACKVRGPTILQHQYAGLAAHLLLDLGVAAAETAPGGRLPDLRGDFDHINDIVGRLMRQVDAIIATVSPWVGRIDRHFGAEYAAFNRLGIAFARDMGWRSATKLAPLADEPRAAAVAVLDKRSAFVAKSLLDPPGLAKLLVRFVKTSESDDVAKVIEALRGAPPTPSPSGGKAPSTKKPKKKVAVLGGGIGGLTAAHELSLRGFEVDVYEATSTVGGKAQSQFFPFPDRSGGKDLPGEHGFRFFPSFYRHVVDTMQRIPTPDGSVGARLRRSDEMAMAERGAFYTFERHPPRELGDFFQITDTTRAFFAQSKVADADVARFGHAMLRFMVSCDERRLGVYEKMSFWDFVGGDACTEPFQKYLRTPRFMVAMDPKNGSARTVATKAIQILADFFRNGTRTDGVLDGPTTRRWLDPWYAHLLQNGVKFHFDAPTDELVLQGKRIAGARVRGATIAADHYVLAVPLDRVFSLISDRLAAADPALANLRELRDATSWMVGSQFYFSEPLAICKGHVAYPDSHWAVSSVTQGQFWKDGVTPFGDGRVKDILSVDVSDWSTVSPRIGKAARQCANKDEVLDEVWAQLEESLGARIDEKKLLARHLDDNVSWGPDGVRNTTPLLVHPPGSWFRRPGADLRIENLFLASDYVKTNTDLATMEGANEAARRAVNALLETEGSSAAPCPIWSMDDGLGPLVAAAKIVDRDLYLIESAAPRELTRFSGTLAALHGPPPSTTSALAELEDSLVRALRLIRRP